MKFSTRQDIEAPIDYVFARASDFAGFERQAMRRGADVKRLGSDGAVAEGTQWDIAFKFRGKDRQMRAEIETLDNPNLIVIDTQSSGVDGVTRLEMVALSPKRTRIAVSIDISPKTLSARLLVQSLKLAKASLTSRFSGRVESFAKTVEEDYRKGA